MIAICRTPHAPPSRFPESTRAPAPTRPRFRAAAVALLAFAMLTPACLLGGRSRVRDGQLYAPGTPTYDAYFREVHGVQAASPKWSDERKTARKPLCDELKTSCDAPDATLAQLTHERMSEVARQSGPLSLELVGDDARMVAANGAKGIPASARSLFHAVEITAKGELDRGRRMRATSLKVDQLVRQGHDYEERVDRDFTQKNAGKASEVKNELAASVDVLTPHAATTRAYAQGAEDFVLDLKRAIVTASATPVAPASSAPAGAGAAPKGRGTVAPPSPPTLPSISAKPTPATDGDAASAKPAAKKPAAAPAEEVFNP